LYVGRRGRALSVGAGPMPTERARARQRGGPAHGQAFTYIDEMVRTILAGGHLTPMPRGDGGGGGGGIRMVGGGALQPMQTAEQLMRSTEQAFVAQAVAEGNIVSVVANIRCGAGGGRAAAGWRRLRGQRACKECIVPVVASGGRPWHGA
jgi:hypothetical protein